MLKQLFHPLLLLISIQPSVISLPTSTIISRSHKCLEPIRMETNEELRSMSEFNRAKDVADENSAVWSVSSLCSTTATDRSSQKQQKAKGEALEVDQSSEKCVMHSSSISSFV
ncbi:hypothetical protein KIN20_032750 [Parelaphostrongylus tenuis]|uniref:Uncharacterized protein n=1 Tax=Parelaphostrongylus tenuis TaxID=148309 RepID=A0AAD5WHQ5_PARTN|nr:hypothetical protein KIN20_032750 [Parelaphostrongylus tenuis]